MNIYVYSDESGVFDKNHEKYFVYAGLIFLDKKEKDIKSNKYKNLEKNIKLEKNIDDFIELKGNILDAKTKHRIFKYFKNEYKFAVIVELNKTYEYSGKKNKQRFLDYAFKRILKHSINYLIKNNIIKKDEIKIISINCDEHTISTNSRYELKENILNEFKYGVVNFEKNYQFPPIIPNILDVNLKYCNSKNSSLIRAADVIANKIYNHFSKNIDIEYIHRNVNLLILP